MPFALAQPFDIDDLCQTLKLQGFVYVSGLYPESTLDALYLEIKQHDEQYTLDIAGIGRGDDHTVLPAIRTDKIHWIDGSSSAQRAFLAQLETLRCAINARLLLGLFHTESHFAVYRTGDYYKRHVDSFKGQKNRILSMVTYLNPTWQATDGGLLHLYQSEQSPLPFISIIPSWGTAVFFLSEEIPHEVSPSISHRYSIATWFRCNSIIPV